MFRRKKPLDEAELVETPIEKKEEKEVLPKNEKSPIEIKAEQINEMKAPEPDKSKSAGDPEVLVQIVHDNVTGVPSVLVREDVDILEVYAVAMPFVKAIEEKLIEKNFNNLQTK